MFHLDCTAHELQEHWQALWRQGVMPKMEEELRITAKEEEQHRYVLVACILIVHAAVC